MHYSTVSDSSVELGSFCKLALAPARFLPTSRCSCSAPIDLLCAMSVFIAAHRVLHSFELHYKFAILMPIRRVAKTIAEKKEVLDWIEAHGGGVPARALNYFQNEKGWKISGAQIRYWRKNRVAIRNAQFLQLRLKSGGAKPTLGEIEDLLFDQILYLSSNKEKVSRQWIQTPARELVKDELENSAFTASGK